jgi:hypothetical protein
LRGTPLTAWASRVPVDFPVMHAIATTPVGPTGRTRSTCPADCGLPRALDGSAPTFAFSRPARRSLTLRPACALSRLTRPFFIGVFQRKSLPPLPAPTASGWSDPLPGGTHTHWKPPSLHGTRRVEMWRGGLGRDLDSLLLALSSASVPAFQPCSVSTSRSSNRTCGFPASGFRTGAHAFAHVKLRVRS